MNERNSVPENAIPQKALLSRVIVSEVLKEVKTTVQKTFDWEINQPPINIYFRQGPVKPSPENPDQIPGCMTTLTDGKLVISLPVEYFGEISGAYPKFEERQKSSLGVMYLFRTVFQSLLSSSLREQRIADDRKLVEFFYQKLIDQLGEQSQTSEEGIPKDKKLVVVGRGINLALIAQESTGQITLANFLDDYQLTVFDILSQLAEKTFSQRMTKKHFWFAWPEEWPPQLKVEPQVAEEIESLLIEMGLMDQNRQVTDHQNLLQKFLSNELAIFAAQQLVNQLYLEDEERQQERKLIPDDDLEEELPIATTAATYRVIEQAERESGKRPREKRPSPKGSFKNNPE